MPSKLTAKEKARIEGLLVDYEIIPLTSHHANLLSWARLLESGKYRQLKEQLRAVGNYRCCLGVACDAYRECHPEVRWKKNKFLGSWEVMPPQVACTLGFPVDNTASGNPNILRRKDSHRIDFGGIPFAELNDSFNLNFRQIAYIIRQAVKLGKEKKRAA